MRRTAAADGLARVWLLILLIVALAAAGGGAYYWRHRSDNSNKNQTTANQTAKTTNTKPKVPTVSPPKSAAGAAMTISDLGVKVSVPASLSGLSYTVTTATGPQGDITTVQFIMKSYSTLANQCAGVPDTTVHPFANLSKAVTSQPSGVVKSFRDYSIVNSGSSLPPNFSCKDSGVQQQLVSLGTQLTADLQTMFQSAQEI